MREATHQDWSQGIPVHTDVMRGDTLLLRGEDYMALRGRLTDAEAEVGMNSGKWVPRPMPPDEVAAVVAGLYTMKGVGAVPKHSKDAVDRALARVTKWPR